MVEALIEGHFDLGKARCDRRRRETEVRSERHVAMRSSEFIQRRPVMMDTSVSL
jgi:hypothetical protein